MFNNAMCYICNLKESGLSLIVAGFSHGIDIVLHVTGSNFVRYSFK